MDWKIKGFDKVKELRINSKNKLFVGVKGKSKYFIKDYVVRKGREKDDLLKVKCEILAYKNIKSISLPKLYKADYKNRILILNWTHFEAVKQTKKTVSKIIDFYFNKMIKIQASFLPKVTYDYYQRSLLKRAKELQKKKIINNLNKVIELFGENKNKVNKASKYFSHGDLHLGNFKYLDNKLTITDLEHSRRDNAMYDLASIYVSIYHRKSLREYFYEKIKKRGIFDQELFKLMIYRRCIEILYAMKAHKHAQHYKNAKRLSAT